ncbi:hypothetical protein [Streptomyces bluensis]|uniref:hypothetical protein n=1 Tax=Streptomyces bluensis TaxID=33897 RepID=UPI00167685C8|nr:hypothetical protein [Streptomyces bluensis]GGZ88067.1 hypothetical protein GCM10010344_64500 [Streptomyces bluensis]
MSVATLQRDVLSVNAELLEGLMAAPETAVSGAPLPCPNGAAIIILGAKEPKEPKEPKGR